MKTNCTSRVVGSNIRTGHLLCVLQEGLIHTNQTSQIFPAEGKTSVPSFSDSSCRFIILITISVNVCISRFPSCGIQNIKPQACRHICLPVHCHLKGAILSRKVTLLIVEPHSEHNPELGICHQPFIFTPQH